MALLAIIVLLPSLQALSLGGKKLSPITYVPGDLIVNSYKIYGSDKPVKVLLDSGPFTNITTTDVVDDQFDLLIHFPQGERIPPGSYNFALSVVEDSPPGSGIGAQVAVSKSFEVIVYSWEKEIQATLSAFNINEGSNATFQLGVSSQTYADIEEVQGFISVYNASRAKLGEAATEKKPLKSLQGISFNVPFNTARFPTGSYLAKAVVTYDENRKETNASFLIGTMDLIVKNYTAEFPPGFVEFSIFVGNGWGNSLRNVYAKLLINGQELLQTPSIDLEPWQEGQLKGIMKVDLSPGTYEGRLILYYEGESKELPVSIRIIPLPVIAEPVVEVEKQVQQAQAFAFIPAIAGLILLAVIIIIFFRRRKNRKKGNEF